MKLVSRGNSVADVINDIKNLSKEITKELNLAMENIEKIILEIKEKLRK